MPGVAEQPCSDAEAIADGQRPGLPGTSESNAPGSPAIDP
jgi:hypothetical protein